jgi:hypothetical protein
MMNVFAPSEVRWTGSISQWFVSAGLPQYTPAKLFHLSVFAGWTFLLGGALSNGYRKPLSRKHWQICLYSLIGFVGIPEGLQCLNPNRHFAWMDVGINLLGGLSGLGFRYYFCRLQWINTDFSC